MKPQEFDLSPEDKNYIAEYTKLGLQIRDISSGGSDPEALVYSIDDRVNRDRERVSKLPEEEYAEFILAMACLWGAQVCKQYQWSWAKLEYDNGKGGWAIVSPDRRFANFPLYYFKRFIDQPNREITVALLFNLLEPSALESNLPNVQPGDYQVLS